MPGGHTQGFHQLGPPALLEAGNQHAELWCDDGARACHFRLDRSRPDWFSVGSAAQKILAEPRPLGSVFFHGHYSTHDRP
jgi:hypothetical protein